MQYIYVAEDRRDFNSQVDKMILSSEITVPGLFFFLNYWNWSVIQVSPGCWLTLAHDKLLQLSENVPSYVFFRSRHWRNGVYSRWNGQYWKCQWCWRPLQFAERFEWRRLHTFPQTECQALIVPELPAQLRTIWLKHLYMNIPEVSTATLPGNPNHNTLTWRFLTHSSLHCNHNIRYCKSWVCCRELWLGTVVT